MLILKSHSMGHHATSEIYKRGFDRNIETKFLK